MAPLVVAWHEVGHAIVASALGLRPTRCDIISEPGLRLGHFEHEELTNDQQAAYARNDPDLLIKLTLISLGGAAAELLLAEKLGHEWNPGGSIKDRRTALELLRRLGKDEPEYLRACLTDAGTLLVHPPIRELILETAAEMLRERNELDRAALAGLYHQVTTVN